MIADNALGIHAIGTEQTALTICVNVTVNISYTFSGVMLARAETAWQFAGSYGYKGKIDAQTSLSGEIVSTYKYSTDTNVGVIIGAALRGEYVYDKGVGIRAVEFVSIRGSYGYRSQLSATFRHSASIDGSYSYSGRLIASVPRPQPLFNWSEGVAYRVVRKDQSPAGLQQGGIKRDRLFSTIQRLGL